MKRTRSPRLTPNRSPWYLARIAADLTLEAAAARSGVSASQIHRIETGHTRNPHPLTRRALAEAYGCPEEALTSEPPAISTPQRSTGNYANA